MPELSSVGVLSAFAAGAISFLSPCVLPLVPGYVSYVAGESLNGVETPQGSAAKLPALGLSSLFVLGFSTVFVRSEEHTSELQSLMRISYAVFCLKKKTTHNHQTQIHNNTH